ncbi:hypothetical protein MCEMIE22_00107 [Mycobacteriaceae bacterium]
MSIDLNRDAVPRTRCPRCASDVPAGEFCGICGSDLTGGRTGGRRWLRPGTFGAAPGEAVLRPYLFSSLFPHLPNRSRRPFRIILSVGALALVAFAVARLPSAGIALAALGLPLLFGLYLRASGVGRDIPRSSLVLTATLGAALGIGWVMVTGQLVSASYGLPMSVGLALRHELRTGIAIPTAAMILMVVPVIVVRLLARSARRPAESLDGFVIGALGALAFSATATLTRLAPRFFAPAAVSDDNGPFLFGPRSAGLFAHTRPLRSLLVESVLCGVTIPVTAAAAGGIVGILLWFRHPGADDTEDHPGRVRMVLALLAAAALVIHTAVGTIDMVGLPETWMIGLHLVMTLAVLLALRLALQLALLHEAHDPIDESRPLLCVHCEMVVPDMAFCPACGVASRASSRESRRDRRGERPQPLDVSAGAGPPAGEQTYPGYAIGAQTYSAPAVRRPRLNWLLGRWGIGITTVAVTLGAVAIVLTPRVAHYMCPPECGEPPTGTPVMALPRFAAPGGEFSVAYPAEGSAYTVTTGDAGVTATFTGGDGGVMQLFSLPANGRSAREIVKAALRKAYPDATFAYEIPNAMVGYQPGYGEAADDWPQSTTARYSRVRIIGLAAVKNDVALVAFAIGPYRVFGPDSGPGIPSGANLQLAQDMGKYVNSFRWAGDPLR